MFFCQSRNQFALVIRTLFEREQGFRRSFRGNKWGVARPELLWSSVFHATGKPGHRKLSSAVIDSNGATWETRHGHH